MHFPIDTYLGVAQLVARYLGVVEAASSSLVTQTRIIRVVLSKRTAQLGLFLLRKTPPAYPKVMGSRRRAFGSEKSIMQGRN